MAYRSQRFAYADMIKTGSNWTSRVMLRRARVPVCMGNGEHRPAWWVREQLGEGGATNVIGQKPGRLFFGTMRSGLPWYGSWYRHALHRHGAVDEVRAMGRGSTAFADVLAGALSAGEHWGRNPFIFCQRMDTGLRWVEGESLWSYATRYFYATQDGSAWAVDALVPMEHLREGLAELGLVEPILQPKNVGKGEPAQLTPEQRAAILKADGPLMDVLGYPEVPAVLRVDRGRVYPLEAA